MVLRPHSIRVLSVSKGQQPADPCICGAPHDQRRRGCDSKCSAQYYDSLRLQGFEGYAAPGTQSCNCGFDLARTQPKGQEDRKAKLACERGKRNDSPSPHRARHDIRIDAVDKALDDLTGLDELRCPLRIQISAPAGSSPTARSVRHHYDRRNG